MYQRSKDWLISNSKKVLLIGVVITPPLAYTSSVIASGDINRSRPGKFHFEFEKWNRSFDVAALRRGYQVYKEVCSSCHSMRFLNFRHLIGTIMTESQAKKEASTLTVVDGPDEKGNMFTRPGILKDKYPSPYPNEQAARAANNGAAPPDLSLIAEARHDGIAQIFQLLLGYTDEIPAGVELSKGQYYNPFMEGGAIAMPPPLNDGAVTFSDGTPATVTQMARDMVEFLYWSQQRRLDTQKQYAFFGLQWTLLWAVFSYWNYRYWWSIFKTQRITWKMKPSFGTAH